MALTGTGIRIGSADEFDATIRFPRGMASDGTTCHIFSNSKGYSLNVSTGVATAIGTIANFGVSETALRSATYHNSQIIFYGHFNKRFYSFPGTGAVTALSPVLTAPAGITSTPDLWGVASLGGVVYGLDRAEHILVSVNLTTGALTRIGTVTNYGLTGSPNIQAFTAYNGELIAASGGLQELVRISETTGVATGIISGADLPDAAPEALVEHGGQLLMAGSVADALFRLYDVLWDDTIATLEVDEGATQNLLDFSTVSQDAAAFTLQGTPPAWVSTVGTTLVATNVPQVSADETHNVVARAIRDTGFVDKTLSVLIRNGLGFVETIGDQTFPVGTPVDLLLPLATGGVGAITYALTGTLPDGLTFDATTRRVTGTPTGMEGTFPMIAFVYTATDTAGTVVTINFNMQAVPPPLAFEAGVTNQSFNVGNAVALTLPAAMGGVGTITNALTGTLPTGLTFDATTRQISGTPTGRFTSAEFTFTATDTAGTVVTLTFNIEVTASPITFLPISIPNQTWRVGTAVDVQLPLASGGVGALTLTIEPALPAGVAFNATTRQLTGTPTAESAATDYRYIATDTENIASELTFSITVEPAPPVAEPVDFGAATIADQILVVGTAVDIQLPAATGGMGTLMYGFSPALPVGLTLDQTTQRLTGTPTAAQPQETYRYFASEQINSVIDADGNVAVDGAGDEVIDEATTDFIEFELQVTGELAFLDTVPDQRWITNVPVSLELPQAVGGMGTITYSLTPSTLPVGTSLTNRTIAGTPTTVKVRTLHTWTATDAGNNSVTISFNITVGNVITFIPDNIPTQNYTIGEAVDVTLPRATDGTMTSPVLSLTPVMPTGLSFISSSRKITGVPREVVNGRLYEYTARNAVTYATLSFRVFVRATAYTLANRDLETLLPPNATELELAVESMLRENFLPVDENLHVKMPVIDAWDPDEIPAHVIPYLGVNLSITVDVGLPEQEQRNLLKASYGIHSYEGTPQSLLDVINALGYGGAVIVEGATDPSDTTTHWAHYSICINQPITIADAQRLVDLVKDLAPIRCKLVSVDVVEAANDYDGSINYDGMHTYGQISTLSGLNL